MEALSLRRTVRAIERSSITTNPPRPDAEFGRPQWAFGTATWAFAGPSRIVVRTRRSGRWYLARGRRRERCDVEPCRGPRAARVADGHADARGRSWRLRRRRRTRSVRIDLATGAVETLRRHPARSRTSGYISEPRAIEFATDGGLTAHAFFYPPRHAACTALAGERPPLIVISHGGPTTATTATLDLRVQYLDEPRLRRRRRELRRQLRLRPRVSPAAERAVGHRRRRGHGERGAVSGRAGQGRSGSPDHPRRQRRRLHHARGADVSSRRVQGRRQLLRHQRHRGAGAATRTSSSRDISTRWSARTRRRGSSTARDRRFISSIGCRVR